MRLVGEIPPNRHPSSLSPLDTPETCVLHEPKFGLFCDKSSDACWVLRVGASKGHLAQQATPPRTTMTTSFTAREATQTHSLECTQNEFRRWKGHICYPRC